MHWLLAFFLFSAATSFAQETNNDFVFIDEGNSINVIRYIGSSGTVSIPNSINSKLVLKIGDSAFYRTQIRSISLPSTLKVIGNKSFSWCEKLTNIVLPEGLEAVGDNAFEITGINSIILPNSITNIGEYAFFSTPLVNVSLPQGINEVKKYTFANCMQLTNILIGTNVTSIGDNAFESCKSLSSVNLPNSITNLGTYVFYYCTNLESVNIPQNVQKLRNGLFSGCKKITSIEVPNSVTEIGDIGAGAFEYCSSLTNITLSTNLLKIGNFTFRDCSNLPAVYLPSNVNNIGFNAFDNTKSLNGLYFKGTPPLTFNADLSSSSTNLVIYYLKQGTNVSWQTKIPGVPLKFWSNSIPTLKISQNPSNQNLSLKFFKERTFNYSLFKSTDLNSWNFVSRKVGDSTEEIIEMSPNFQKEFFNIQQEDN